MYIYTHTHQTITPTLHQILSSPSLKNFHYMTMEKQVCCPKKASSPLNIRNSSQTISKTKPKIRIIHIFAPEIIKTDAANFRELVQRLTGKPTAADLNGAATANEGASRKRAPRMKMRAGFVHAEFRERVKEEEEEIWRSANSGGGFLGGFGEFDGFMHELNHFQFLEGVNLLH